MKKVKISDVLIYIVYGVVVLMVGSMFAMGLTGIDFFGYVMVTCLAVALVLIMAVNLMQDREDMLKKEEEHDEHLIDMVDPDWGKSKPGDSHTTLTKGRRTASWRRSRAWPS